MSRRFFAPVSTAHAHVTAPLGARSGLASITVAAVLWGTTGVAAEFLHDSAGLSPVGIGFHRLAIAAVALLILIPGGIAAATRAVRAAPVELLLSGVGLAAYQVLYFVAVALTGVGVATVVSLGLAPMLVAGWEAARTRRLPGRRTGWSLLTGVAGLLLCTASSVQQPAGAARGSALGFLCAVGCAASYAATTVLSRHACRRVGPLTTTTVSSAVGAVVLAPLAAVSGFAVAVRPDTVAVLMYLGVVTTALAYALFHAGLRDTPGSTAVVLTLLEPLTAALLARWVLGEPLPGTTVAGGALLLGAVTALYLAPTTTRQ